MNLRTYVFGFLIISGFLAASIAYLEGMADVNNYNVNLQGYNGTYNTLNKIGAIQKDFNKTQTGLNQVISQDKETQYPNFVVGLFDKAKNIFFGVGNTVTGVMGGTFGVLTIGVDFVNDLGISTFGKFPTWVNGLLITIILVSVVVMMFRLFNGREI